MSRDGGAERGGELSPVGLSHATPHCTLYNIYHGTRLQYPRLLLALARIHRRGCVHEWKDLGSAAKVHGVMTGILAGSTSRKYPTGHDYKCNPVRPAGDALASQATHFKDRGPRMPRKMAHPRRSSQGGPEVITGEIAGRPVHVQTIVESTEQSINNEFPALYTQLHDDFEEWWE